MSEIGCLKYVPSEEIKQSSSSESEDWEDWEDEDEINVPQEITEELVRYTENFLVQDIKEYLAKDYPKIDGIPIQYFSFKNLDFFRISFSPLFDREQHFDLYYMLQILKYQGEPLSKSNAAISVGAAIRISSTIGKREHYDRIIEIVKDSFIPQIIDDVQTNECRHFFNKYVYDTCQSHLSKIECSNFVPSEEIKQSSSLQWSDNNNLCFTGILQEIKQGSSSENKDCDEDEMMVPRDIKKELLTYTCWKNCLVQDIRKYLATDYLKNDGIPIQSFP